jgi:pyrroline-5-carboxylate reductase
MHINQSVSISKSNRGLLTKNLPLQATLAFIGGGNMATSLISGLIADGHDPQRILVSDTEHEKLANLSARFGVRSISSNIEIVTHADVLILAVKPQVLRAVCEEIRSTVQTYRPLVISIAAGIREIFLQQWLENGVALVRTMPNTPAMLQAGATVLHADRNMVSSQQRDIAESVMRAVGLTCWVEDEALLDAATALSGSGPAYFFLVMEAMEQAGISLGLDAGISHLLTIQTALGAARMAMESVETPAMLRERVTSRGGTTEQALSIFEDGGLRNLFTQALTGARDRSVELSKILGKVSG